MSAIDIATSLLRGVHVAALVSLFGTLLFVGAALPADGDDPAQMRGLLRRLALVSALAGLIAGVAWLMMQTAAIAGADSVAMTLHAVPTVALQTQFGHWLLLRLALLIAVLPLLMRAMDRHPDRVGRRGACRAAVFSAMRARWVAVPALQLIVSEALHMLAAGAWLGGLLPLFLAVGRLPHEAAATDVPQFHADRTCRRCCCSRGTAVVQVGDADGRAAWAVRDPLRPRRAGEARAVRRAARCSPRPIDLCSPIA